jgi:transcription initiation factor IIE alpha subunit
VSDYWPAIDLPLFRQMAPAQQHSSTSMAAADSLDEDTLNRLQRQVLAVIAASSAGLTDEEIQLRTGMNPSTQRPRRIELERRGFITQAGTRKTSSGRNAVVWRAV